MKLSLNQTWAILLLCLLCSACFPARKLTVGATATLLEGVARASNRQSDLKLIREGMPAYLMLMDGMVELWPDNDDLLIASAKAYSSYASVFVEEVDKEYAQVLFERAKEYALRSLARRGVKDPLQCSLEDFEEALEGLGKKDLPYLFWGASCWADWIGRHLDSMEALAELPRVERMMKRVLEIDESFYYGGAHLFMGIWFSSRPRMAGGDLPRSKGHFLKALDLGQGKFLMAYVYFASYYARHVLDKELFISTLQNVLETPANISPDLTLLNTLAKKKAEELLGRMEEYFD